MRQLQELEVYKQKKVEHLRSKIAYHRARMEQAVGDKVAYHQMKIDYAMDKLEYLGVEV